MQAILRFVKIGLSVLMLLGLGFCLWANLGNAPGRSELEKANRHAAEQIVAALDAFKAAQQRYPDSLDALVPDYLSVLPTLQPADRTPSYTAGAGGQHFKLSYPVAPLGTLPADLEHVYSSSDGQWTQVAY